MRRRTVHLSGSQIIDLWKVALSVLLVVFFPWCFMLPLASRSACHTNRMLFLLALTLKIKMKACA